MFHDTIHTRRSVFKRHKGIQVKYIICHSVGVQVHCEVYPKKRLRRQRANRQNVASKRLVVGFEWSELVPLSDLGKQGAPIHPNYLAFDF